MTTKIKNTDSIKMQFTKQSSFPHYNNSIISFNKKSKESTVTMRKKKNKAFSSQSTLNETLQLILSSKVLFIIYIVIIIPWMFFANDFKLLFVESQYDKYFSIINIIIMFFLFLEILFMFIVDENGYGCSLYFWIDCLSLSSMLLDLHFVYNNVNLVKSPYSTTNKNHIMALVYFSIAARVLSRSIKLEKFIFNSAHADETKFEKLLNRRVITLMFLGICTALLTNPNFYIRERIDKVYDLQYFETSVVAYIPELFEVFTKEQEQTPFPLLYAKIGNLITFTNYTNTSNYRNDEIFEYKSPFPENSTTSTYVHMIFDNKYEIRLLLTLNTIRTSLTFAVVLFGMISFNFSTKKLAIEPIKKMTQKIKNLSINPIAALQQNLEMDSKISKLKQKVSSRPLETTILEKTVTKICGLLSLGFGEAGAEIISTVLKEGVDADMNPMIPGKKVMAIYGFCDIRNFTDTTEVLQEQVMIFVNEVAEIVHEITAEYMGSANKNIGDAFLLVWKIDSSYTKRKYNASTGTYDLELINNREVNQIVTMALIAFIKIIIEIKRSKKLFVYTQNEALNQRMPNYTVKLGFGLHVGYSIEGAIGSMFKIDASYLSPHVDMAGAIQEKTKDYGKQIILSGEFVKYLSPEAKNAVRQLDQFKEYSIYTIDMDLSQVFPDVSPLNDVNAVSPNKKDDKVTDLEIKMQNIKEQREKAKKRYNDVVHKKINIWNEYEQSDDFKNVRRRYTEKFYTMYQKGFNEYINGNWQQAKDLLKQSIQALDNSYCGSGNNSNTGEVSVENILKFMEGYNNEAPDDWMGYRPEGGGH